MYEWVAALIAGLIGGVANAILTGGFQMPRVTHGDEDQTIIDPGFIGTILIGGVAGIGVWGSGAEVSFSDTNLNVKPIIGALLAGCAGAEVLNSLIARQYSAATNRQTGSATESNAAAVERAAGALDKMADVVQSSKEKERETQQGKDELKDAQKGEPKGES